MSKHGDIATGPGWELRCGRWQDALADVETVDAVITDPPYSERTHGAYSEMASVGRAAIEYAHLSPADVHGFAASWAPRCAGWFCAMSDHCLAPAWSDAFEAEGRYSFSPIACIEPGARVRLCGDGPAQWSVWMNVCRPRTRAAQKWGALPGGYVVPPSEGWRGGARNGVMGSKPPWLMRAIVRDYSRPGDLVCDPCAGGATTLLAAVTEGRRAIGAEMDPVTFDLAVRRLRKGYTPDLFTEAAPEVKAAEQLALGGSDD